jgi:small ligand-binding sensory domain FIST
MNDAEPRPAFAAAHISVGTLEGAEFVEDTRATTIAAALLEALPATLRCDCDLALVFVTSHLRDELATLTRELRMRLGARVLLASTAESIVGTDEEIEREPAVALLAAKLPGVQLTPFMLSAQHLSEWSTILGDHTIFSEAIGAPPAPKAFLLIADPFSVPVEAAGALGIGVLQAFNEFYPGVPVVGGIASGGAFQGANVLALNEVTRQDGLIGVALSGDITVDVIVSQGCRPIGKVHVVTAARDNLILGLDGERPIDLFNQLVDELPDGDRQLLQTAGLYVGRAVRNASDASEDPGRGDFLIRGVLGADRSSGGLLIGDTTEVGDVIQFHVRDAATALEDLELALAPQTLYSRADGGLLFTCNGRGRRLFETASADIRAIQTSLSDAGSIPFAGFFCGGEIGPIGRRNYLHGHTASIILFRTDTGSAS